MIIWKRNGYSVSKTETLRCACYLIKSDRANVLIDTGMKFERGAIARSIRHMGIDRIDAIFLTHSHTDHAANAKIFSDIYHCPVYISPKGLDKVRTGSCTMPEGTRFHSRLICSIEQKIHFYNFTRFEACPEARALNNDVVKSYFGEHVKLLETPGHTDDSLSIVVDHAVAIAGDAMVNVFGNKYPPFADDEENIKPSWNKLIDEECELFCPAHGKPFYRHDLIEAYKKRLTI